MYLAKKAITRPVGQPSDDPETAEFERELLAKVNALGVGPQAVGGTNTALAVNIETYPTHITSLPVAVNLQCHSARSKHARRCRPAPRGTPATRATLRSAPRRDDVAALVALINAAYARHGAPRLPRHAPHATATTSRSRHRRHHRRRESTAASPRCVRHRRHRRPRALSACSPSTSRCTGRGIGSLLDRARRSRARATPVPRRMRIETVKRGRPHPVLRSARLPRHRRDRRPGVERRRGLGRRHPVARWSTWRSDSR